MKILYTFYHGAAFAWSLVHKLTVHPQDDAYLLVADGWDWTVGRPSHVTPLNRFVRAGIFKRVYIYDNRLGRDSELFRTLEESESAILNGMDKRLSEQGVDILDFDKIYSHTDGEDTMGIYLSMKNKQFFHFEHAPNMLNHRTEEWVRGVYSTSKGYQAALLKHKTLFAASPLQKFVLYPNSNREKYEQEKIVVFDAETAVTLLTQTHKELILSIFELDKKKFDDNIAMLLLQSNWLPGEVYKSSEHVKQRFKHHLLYMHYATQCMLDYYLPKDSIPVLKTHPIVPIDPPTSERYFNGVYAFPALFTVLLMKLLPDVKPKCKISLSSTANRSFSGQSSDVHCPGVWLFPLFYDKFFVVLDILQKLNALSKHAGKVFEPIGQIGNILQYNTSLLQTDINNMIQANFNDVEENTLIKFTVSQIMDGQIDEKVATNDFVILTDVFEQLSLEELNKLFSTSYVTRIKINKRAIKKSSSVIAPLQDEHVYLISKDEKWHNLISTYNTVRMNKYAGVSLEVTTDKQFKTDKKIEYYPTNAIINLLDCYKKFGNHYCDNNGNEIQMDGEISENVYRNMEDINIKFAGSGNNRIIFKNLNFIQGCKGNFRIEALDHSTIEIGRLYFVNYGVLIHAANALIKIDDDCMLANGVRIRAMNYHSIYEYDGTRLKNKDLYIGKHVWLGYDSTIYAGANIGNGSIVESSSVVADTVPNNCIVAGNPVRIIRENVFWQFTGNNANYFDLPIKMRTVDDFIAMSRKEH